MFDHISNHLESPSKILVFSTFFSVSGNVIKHGLFCLIYCLDAFKQLQNLQRFNCKRQKVGQLHSNQSSFFLALQSDSKLANFLIKICVIYGSKILFDFKNMSKARTFRQITIDDSSLNIFIFLNR